MVFKQEQKPEAHCGSSIHGGQIHSHEECAADGEVCMCVCMCLYRVGGWRRGGAFEGLDITKHSHASSQYLHFQSYPSSEEISCMLAFHIQPVSVELSIHLSRGFVS